MSIRKKIRNYCENRYILKHRSNYDWLMESKAQLDRHLRHDGINIYYGKIDKMILPAIKLLNAKGYVTSACCFGHTDSGHIPEIAYIQFGFGEMTPETLPDGWRWTANDLMEYTYTSTEAIELTNEIDVVMKELLEWAGTLQFV